MLDYAVEHLGVSHVILVGHTNCGGAAACAKAAAAPSAAPPSSPLERWLAPLVEIAKNTEGDLTALVEANVRAQVANIVKTDVIQHEWTKRDVQVHGWVYELETGNISRFGFLKPIRYEDARVLFSGNSFICALNKVC